MIVEETKLEGCYLIKPSIVEDERGYFFESFNAQRFADLTGLQVHFVQDNQSFSKFGVIRALHAQKGEYAQAKLVRVLQGEVLDVAVDLRKGSPTFGEHIAVKLNDANKLQLFIPRGFLHGFAVLSETAEFFYKCDNFYFKESEQGVFYDDPQLGINWLIPQEKRLLTEKDLNQPCLSKMNAL